MKKTVSEELLVHHIVMRVGVNREVLRKIFQKHSHIPETKYDLLDTRETINKELKIEEHRPSERKKGVITFYQRNEDGEKIKLRSYKSRQNNRQDLEMENLIEVKDLLQYFKDLNCP